MKLTSQLKHRRNGVRPERHLPPPDPATRVELQFVPQQSSPATRRRGGELIVAAGLGAVVVAVGSAFVELVHLPSLSEVSMASFGGVLVLLGALKRRNARSPSAVPAPIVTEPAAAADLPSLTGQLSGVLAQLRREHGVAYRTRTWLEEVLPSAGADFAVPALARDLLGAAALDAGGIRADVAGLADAYSRDEIVSTSGMLLDALHGVLVACEQSKDLEGIRPSDPSYWPAQTC